MAKKEETTEMTTWEQLRERSSVAVLDFLSREEPSREDMVKARVATSVLATVTRHEAAENSRAKVVLQVAKQLGTSKEDFATYLRVSLPELKSLPEGKKPAPKN